MISGTVTASREAIIPVRILVRPQPVQVTAVIDTGFTDYLTLSASEITALELEPVGSRDAMLADGTIKPLNLFRGIVEWQGAMRRIQTLEADGGPLVGMAMLNGSRITLDVVDGGSVTIEPLEQAG